MRNKLSTKALSSLARGREYEGFTPGHHSIASTVAAFSVAPLSPCSTGRSSRGTAWMAGRALVGDEALQQRAAGARIDLGADQPMRHAVVVALELVLTSARGWSGTMSLGTGRKKQPAYAGQKIACAPPPSSTMTLKQRPPSG